MASAVEAKELKNDWIHWEFGDTFNRNYNTYADILVDN